MFETLSFDVPVELLGAFAGASMILTQVLKNNFKVASEYGLLINSLLSGVFAILIALFSESLATGWVGFTLQTIVYFVVISQSASGLYATSKSTGEKLFPVKE